MTQLKDLTSLTKRWNPSPCHVNGINPIDLTGAKNTLRMMDINKTTYIHTKNWHEQPTEKLKKSDFWVIFHWNRTANTHKCFCACVCVYAHTFTYTFISGVLLKLDDKTKVAKVQKLIISECSNMFSKFTYITQLFAIDLCLLLYRRVSHLSKFGLIRMLFVGVLKEDKKYICRKCI